MRNFILVLIALYFAQSCKKRMPQLPKVISSDSYKVLDSSESRLSEIKSINKKNTSLYLDTNNGDFDFYTNISKDSVFINYQTIDSIKVIKLKFPKYNIKTVLYYDENIRAYKNNGIYWSEKTTPSQGILTVSDGTWFDLIRTTKL